MAYQPTQQYSTRRNFLKAALGTGIAFAFNPLEAMAQSSAASIPANAQGTATIFYDSVNPSSPKAAVAAVFDPSNDKYAIKEISSVFSDTNDNEARLMAPAMEKEVRQMSYAEFAKAFGNIASKVKKHDSTAEYRTGTFGIETPSGEKAGIVYFVEVGEVGKGQPEPYALPFGTKVFGGNGASIRKLSQESSDGAGGGGGGGGGGGSGGGGVCLLHGNKVRLSNNKTINIENIRVNDKVVALDIKSNNEIVTKVTKIITNHPRDHYFIVNDNISITNDHPVLVSRENNLMWVRIENLILGDRIKSHNGFNIVKSIIKIDKLVPTVYMETESGNFLVDNGRETFIVKSDYALVEDKLFVSLIN